MLIRAAAFRGRRTLLQRRRRRVQITASLNLAALDFDAAADEIAIESFFLCDSAEETTEKAPSRDSEEK